MTTVRNRSDFEITRDDPYLALMGELCDVYKVYITTENYLNCIQTAVLYFPIQ